MDGKVSQSAGDSAAGAPVLRVAVLSDIQGYPYPEDSGMRNLERALDVIAPLRPDAVVSVGDINDSGNDCDAVRYFKARCDARLGAVPHVACIGNHELCFIRPELRAERTPEAIRRDFNDVFGYPVDARCVRRDVCGYPFVALHLSSEKGYTESEIAEFAEVLAQTVADHPGKPVFAITHYHALGTVNDSRQEEKSGALRRLFDCFPQVVSLSGHTHGSLFDPRSVWQGAFTAFETSTLCYGSLGPRPGTANQISCLLPFGHESVGFLVLDVFPERVVARRFSPRTRAEIGAPWVVPWPHDPERAPFRDEVRRPAENVPQLPADPEPALWYDYGFVYLMFAAASGDVLGYRVVLEDAETSRATEHFQVSEFYRQAQLRSDRVVFRAPPGSLTPGRSYRCRIVPVGFFGTEGRAFAWSFAVKPDYPIRTDAPNALPE